MRGLEESDSGWASFDEADWINLGAVAICITSAALAAGLVEQLDLKVKIRTGTEQEARDAQILLPLKVRRAVARACAQRTT